MSRRRAGRAGSDPPAVGVGVVDRDAALAQHRDRHPDVGQRRHRLAVVADVDALVEAGAGQQQRRDELGGRAGVDLDRAAGHRAVPVDGERQRVALVVDAERPQRVSTSATGRSRMWGSPSKPTCPVASAATGGRNRITVPASPQSTAAGPAAGRG